MIENYRPAGQIVVVSVTRSVWKNPESSGVERKITTSHSV